MSSVWAYVEGARARAVRAAQAVGRYDDLVGLHVVGEDVDGTSVWLPDETAGRSRIAPRTGTIEQEIRSYLTHLRHSGGSLPGKLGADGHIQVDWRHVGMILDRAFTSKTPDLAVGRLLLASGLPVADDAYLDTPITAHLDGRPWHDGPIPYQQAKFLARQLSTACVVVIAYLSGARPGAQPTPGMHRSRHRHGYVAHR